MELIQNNPYRIAGILSNATERELQKQKTKIKAYSKVGKEIISDFDFQILDSITRTEDSIDKAFSTIEQNQDKVNYSLFWFLNESPFDNTAIEYLKNGDEEKAVEIWGKVTINKEVNSKNFSAFNNLGTYKLLSQTQNDIKEGIEVKIKLIESDFFENFAHSVADETFTIDNEKQIEKLVDELLTQFKNRYSSSETLEFFSGCNGTTQQYLSKKFTEEPIHEIESQIESCKKKRKAEKGSAYEFGLKLFTNTKDDLSLLKSLLGTSDLKYKAIADPLANEIMQCGIDYFNRNQENDSSEDYLKQAQKLTKLADSIAVGKLTKDRTKDSLASLEEMKDREVNQAIQVLQSVKDAYEKNQNDILRMVKAKGLSEWEINWSKVNSLIEDSINWDKAIELVQQVVPRENIDKIRSSKNSSKIIEYKELVEFVINKVSYSYKSRIQYLKYWQYRKKKTEIKTSSSTSRVTSISTTKKEKTFWNDGSLIFIIIALGVLIGAFAIWGWTGVIVIIVIVFWLIGKAS